METTGLTFLEAVKALDDGKCKEIKSAFGTIYRLKGGIVTACMRSHFGIEAVPSAFLGEWSLIGVKQKAVFTGVEWHRGDKDNLYPTIKEWPMLKDLVNKPEMKMTLEWDE